MELGITSNNFVHIAGTIQKDPVVRYTAAGLCWATWTTVVESEGHKARSYIPTKAFGDVAQEVEKLGKKDCYVIIEGRIATGSYTTKDGRKVYTVDVVAEEIDFSKGVLPDETDKAVEGFEQVSEDFPF